MLLKETIAFPLNDKEIRHMYVRTAERHSILESPERKKQEKTRPLTSVNAGVNHRKVVWRKEVLLLIFQLRLLGRLLRVYVPCSTAPTRHDCAFTPHTGCFESE